MNKTTKPECLEPPATKPDEKKIQLVVDGCAVKLSFASKPEGAKIESIKKMILNGMARV
jgi:hypothetical protein